MILRKPYAFFIKIFKPLHLLMATLVAYLIYLDNKLLGFFNMYINSATVDSIGKSLKSTLGSPFLYIIPILVIIFSLIVMGIMFRKNKPFKFYIINIFAFVLIIMINLYAINFLGIVEEQIVSVRSAKLIHDIVLINMAIEGITFIFLLIRGLGVNIKTFDFNSDLSAMNISESDKEEFELDVNVDLSEAKRKRKRAFRHLKYAYYEHKFVINCIAIIVICLIAVGIYSGVSIYTKKNVEGTLYSAEEFKFGVDRTLILDKDYQGNLISSNYKIVVVDVKLQSNLSNKKLFANDFKLQVGDTIYTATKSASGAFIDIGNDYDGQVLTPEYENYIFTYFIPKEDVEKSMNFQYYINYGKKITIKLNPKEVEDTIVNVTKNVGEEISFKDTFGDVGFTINNFSIADTFTINYDYCIKENDCIKSKEYLKASLDENFDKTLIKLNVNYKDESRIGISSFYDFFNKFGFISYSINGTWNKQLYSFENIKSTKVNETNTYYIGVNSNIKNAEHIKLEFEIRNTHYEYVLK